MNVNDLEKKRSQFAYRCVNDVWSAYLEVQKEIKNIDCKVPNLSDANKELCKKAKTKYKIADDYKSYVKKIPMMILNNGLGATFAFIYSKKKDGNAWELIYNQINEWLSKEYKNGKCDKKNKCYKNKDIECEKVNLVEWIICLDSQVYRSTTNEVLALFNWLRRFAEGMIEGEE